MTKIAMFLSSHNIGLSSLLTEQAFHFSKLSNIQFVFLAGENEQEKGLQDKLRSNNLVFEVIEGLDDHGSFWSLVKKFRNFIAEQQPDIVHVQTNWQLIIAQITKIFSKREYKILYTIHGYRNNNNNKYKSYFALIIIQTLLRLFTTHVFAASTMVYKKFSFLRRKISILPLGVDDVFFHSSHRVLNSDNGIKIIFPAQFRQGKNQDVLIKAVFEYIQKTSDKSIKITLPGDGPLLHECKNLVKLLELENNIYFPGQVPINDISSMYQDSNVAIVSSNSETFGHAIAEPFVLGLCVITRRTGIAEDIIVHGDNGFIFDYDQEISDVLIQLFRNKELIYKTGRKAFESRDFFRWEAIAKKYEQYIMNLR
jgi:glycosyltransferase involved in cell wall biosynthesis